MCIPSIDLDFVQRYVVRLQYRKIQKLDGERYAVIGL